LIWCFWMKAKNENYSREPNNWDTQREREVSFVQSVLSCATQHNQVQLRDNNHLNKHHHCCCCCWSLFLSSFWKL
jgi:hypothetical protein